MLSDNYDWVRYWYPRRESIKFDNEGFPYEAGFLNPNLVTLASIKHYPCLVLFGEPGVGKSTALTAEFNASRQSAETVSLFRDLAIYSTGAELVHDIFEDQAFRSWHSGNYMLELFLDSLDECRLHAKTIDALLLAHLQRYDLNRLRLRISCRTADWSAVLEKGLPRLWPAEEIAQFRLAPLSRQHVEVAARTEDIIPDDLFRQIQQKQVIALAINPVTLKMLLDLYLSSDRSFPDHRNDILLQGCTRLCEEVNDNRALTQRNEPESARRRLAVAGRIAAACVFSNRSVISRKHWPKNVPAHIVSFDQIRGGKELLDNDAVDVTETALLETLGTSLFEPTADGDGARWSHQTYAEFLAAWYLKNHNLTAERTIGLLLHPSDAEKRIVPQLHEVAANVAHMIPGTIDLISRHDPEVLIRSDMSIATNEEKQVAVAALLQLYATERAHESTYISVDYSSLAHPNLADQLRPYLIESDWNVEVCNLAIKLIRDCKITELQQELLDLVLNISTPMIVRADAAGALKEVGDYETRQQLEPLTRETASIEHEDLRGFAFMATWPEHLSATQLFARLTEPPDGLSGMYTVFLYSHLVPHLKPDDLPVALAWVRTETSRHSSFKTQTLADEIILKSLNHLSDATVRTAVAQIFVSRLRRYEDLLLDHRARESGRQLLQDDQNARRRLFETILGEVVQQDTVWTIPLHSRVLNLQQADVYWLLDLIDNSESTEQLVLTQIIGRRVWEPEPSLLTKLIDRCLKNPSLAGEFRELLHGIELDSVAATNARSAFESYKTHETQTTTRDMLDPPPRERVLRCLDFIDEGKLGGWVRLNMEMTLDDDSTSYQNLEALDLKSLPGWVNADEATRNRIVAASKKFVLEHRPSIYEWLVKNPNYEWIRAGLRAWLLASQESDFVANLDERVFEKWGHILVINPVSDKSEQVQEKYKALVRLVDSKVNLDICHYLSLKIDYDNHESGHTSLLTDLKEYWNEPFAKWLLRRIADLQISSSIFSGALSWLLQHGVAPAQQFAQSLVARSTSSNRRDEQRSIAAAYALATHGDQASWPIVWRAVVRNPLFGRELFLSIASSRRHGGVAFTTTFSEAQLAELYIWLERQFPHAEDERHFGVFTPTSRDEIIWWRDGLLNQLRERGTQEAINAIQRIVNEFPDLPFLRFELRDASAKTRRDTWVPLEPNHLITLLNNEEKRVIQNGEQLLEVLAESLQRLESELQGETPAAIELWNKIGTRRNVIYTPKDEEELSNYVKRHIKRNLIGRGIVLNREVEIRRGTGAGDGERTDIKIDAVDKADSAESLEIISALIETKACWNRDLMSAMEDQLAGRYLKDNECRHGLYLVGWFLCDRWALEDRKRNTPKLDIATVRDELTRQAQELSINGIQVKAVVLNTTLR